jgi:hypothetical protein
MTDPDKPEHQPPPPLPPGQSTFPDPSVWAQYEYEWHRVAMEAAAMTMRQNAVLFSPVPAISVSGLIIPASRTTEGVLVRATSAVWGKS